MRQGGSCTRERTLNFISSKKMLASAFSHDQDPNRTRRLRDEPATAVARPTISIQHLVVIHCHSHLDELAREFEGRRVMRNWRAAVASDVEPRPRDKVEKSV